MAKFKVGSRVYMNESAVVNYGRQWRNVELIVTHVATKYMPAEQFFAKGKPEGYHPGYDKGANGQGLYDLKRASDDFELSMSLYDWELI